jgi:Helicase associated domain
MLASQGFDFGPKPDDEEEEEEKEEEFAAAPTRTTRRRSSASATTAVAKSAGSKRNTEEEEEEHEGDKKPAARRSKYQKTSSSAATAATATSTRYPRRALAAPEAVVSSSTTAAAVAAAAAAKSSSSSTKSSSKRKAVAASASASSAKKKNGKEKKDDDDDDDDADEDGTTTPTKKPRNYNYKVRKLIRRIPIEQEEDVKEQVRKEDAKLLVSDEPMEPDKAKHVDYQTAKSNRTWEEYYFQFLVFKRVYGHGIVPKMFLENEALGRWTCRNRRWKKSGDARLTPSRLRRLNQAGFCFEAKKDPQYWNIQGQTTQADTKWQAFLEKLIAFKQQYGNCLVPKEYGKRIFFS